MGKERFTDKLIGGQRYLYSEAYAHEEFLMDVQEELGSFLGQRNTNSVTETDLAGNAANVKSADGYWKWMDSYAGKVHYGVGDFDIFTFDEVPEIIFVNYRKESIVLTPEIYMPVWLYEEYGSMDLSSEVIKAMALKCGGKVYDDARS